VAITVFDKIISRELPASIVYEDESVLAFHDINKQAKIHVLVIPKKKVRHLAEASTWPEQDLGTFFKKVAEVAQKLGLTEKGYRVVLNTGSDGGQTVDYLHAHILGGEALSGGFA
jgi:histidine triad (HIT) family protein